MNCRRPTRTETLLRASIDIVELKKRNDTLEAENRLLRARLRLADLKLVRSREELPTLLRRQAG